MSAQFCYPSAMNKLKIFLSTEAMVDVTLHCDGERLKAHKIVLSACSPFFRSLFFKNPCKHPIVILKDVKYAELKLVIDFMYCGEVNIAKDQLSAFIKTAQTLKVKGLGEVELQNSQSDGEIENSPDDKSKSPTGNASKNQSGDTVCFKWNNYRNMMNEFKTFFLSETMVDVTLGCDGQSLQAHKIILSAYSPFFESLFLENSCEHPIVILKDVEYTELKSVIDFMYCSEKVTEDQLSAVIKTALALKVEGLMEMDSQNSQSNDESGNPIDDESNNQSSDELSKQPICMIDVSNWTLMEKQSLSAQNVDGGFVTEIKQENISDDDEMEVSASYTKTSMVSLQSHDAYPFIKSEHDQPVEQNFDRKFALKEENIFQQILAIDNLKRQSFQSSFQPNMDLHEESTDSTSNLVPVTSTIVDNQEPRTSSVSAHKCWRKKKKLRKIPEKSEQQPYNSQKLEVINSDRHTCEVCEKSFSRHDSLVRHRLTHNANTALSLCCALCKKAFYRKDTLKRHILMHERLLMNPGPSNVDEGLSIDSGSSNANTEEIIAGLSESSVSTVEYQGRHTCDICNKTYSKKFNLIRHLRTHAEDKLFECEICGKAFHRKEKCDAHQMAHEKEAVCHSYDECSEVFTSESELFNLLTAAN